MNDSITHRGIRRIRGQRIKILFYILALSVLFISILFFTLSATKPIMGVFIAFDNGEWAVQSVDPNGAASRAGIAVGDKPEVINGEEPRIFLEKYLEQGLIQGHLIQELTVSNGGGQLKTVDLNSSSPSPQSLIELSTWFFASLVFWITGFFVYFKKPESTPALILCLFGAIFGLALGANMAGERAITPAIHLAVISATIGPWLLLHFFLVLPEERARLRSNPLVYLIYLPVIITVILYPVIGFADGQPLQAFRTLRLLGYGIGLLAVIVVSIMNYVRATSLRTRQQMKIILIGCLAALIPFLSLSVLPAAIEGSNIMPAGFSMLFISFIPLSMGYAVITKRFMDIDIFIRRGAVYGLITLFMAAILVVAISLTLVFRESAGVFERVLVALVLGGLATALFGPTKKWVENVVDRLFYKDRYDYRTTIKELSDSLNRLNDVSSASSIIVSTTMNALNLAGACLFVETIDGVFQASAAQGIFADSKKQRQLLRLILQQRNSLTEFPNSASSVDSDIAYLVPLIIGDMEIGFLFLSPKVSRQSYLPADMFLIQDLAVVAAVSLRSMLVIANDIAERKRAEEAMKRAAEEWRTTFDSITDMIAIIDTKRKIVRVNKAFARAFNITPKKALGKICHEVVHNSEEPHLLCTFDYTLTTKKSCNHEFFEPKLDKYFECTISPLLNDKGDITGVVHILKDITQRKNMEAEQSALRNKAEISSRLASVGEMAAGIAHEINNPLTGVIGFSQLLLDEDLPPGIRDQVKIIAEGSNQVKDIVKRMLTFARQSKPFKTSLNIHELIDNTLELRRYVFKTANIKVIKQYDTTLPWVTVDPGQLQQVFMNVIVNAEYSMKKAHGRGDLIITTKKDDNYVWIIFKDDGEGMSEKTLSKLFHPFFTTKDPGDGTGLGLSLSHSIIIEHSGTIEAKSEPGQGATFTIKLPITPQTEAPNPEAPLETGAKKASARKASVLVIDDESAVRALVERVMVLNGHSVEEADEPAQALEKLERNKYDIILLDVRMPGMSGKELYAKISDKWPGMAHKVIFITGDASDASTVQFFKEHDLPFITKPFDHSALLQEIDKALGHE